MSAVFRIFRRVLGCSGALLLTAASMAQGPPIVAGPGPSPLPPAVYPVQEDPSASGQFRFSTPGAPTDVQFDPAAGPFVKQLIPVYDRDFDGAVDLNDITQLLANLPIVLTEHLRVAPNDPWTGWYEELLTPGWEWGQVSVTAAPNTPGVLTNQSTSLSSGNQVVDFSFDPLAPGSEIVIRKELMFTGTVDPQMAGDWFNRAYTIDVLEHPRSGVVPEPGAAALAGLIVCGVATVGVHRRWDQQVEQQA